HVVNAHFPSTPLTHHRSPRDPTKTHGFRSLKSTPQYALQRIRSAHLESLLAPFTKNAATEVAT
ncbi:MAG: hypothetical protein ACR2NK_03175, partial [Mariniblastus sp.]